jgi:dihydroorotate dehydrogenase (NAD+) catalytic subunit
MSLTIATGKRDLILSPACMNVAGMLGFSDQAKRAFDLSNLGSFVTNPISLAPRTPAHPPRVLEFSGGFLLHTGHPNPGLRKVLRTYASQWKSLPCPVIVHTLVQTAEEAAHMTEHLEEIEAVSAVEIGLGDIDALSAEKIVSTASRGELPIIANMPVTVDTAVILSVAAAGPSAISFGPPRGTIQHSDGRLISGRIFGPAVLPIALRSVSRAAELVEVPIIASGGIFHIADVEAMLKAGASAVQLDSVLWTDPGEIFSFFHDE